MADEEGLVERDVFDTDDSPVGQLDDLIDQQKRESMREGLFYLLRVEYRRLVRIVYRRILEMLVFFYILLDPFCEIHIGGMPGTIRDDMALDGIPDQSEVANDIEQFVPCRLVGEP